MTKDKNHPQDEKDDGLDFINDVMPEKEVAPDNLTESKSLKKNSTAALALAVQSSLYSETVLEGEEIIKVSPGLIDKNPYQNRFNFNEKKLEELANDILNNGQHQPCVVRKVGSRYELAAGERRYRACAMAKIPVAVVVREISNEEMRLICFSENEKREDTNMVEKYLGIQSMIRDGKTRDDVAEFFPLSPATVSRISKLSNLPDILLIDLAKSLFAEKLNSMRIDEIGSLFRDFMEHEEVLSKMLREEIAEFEHLTFDTETRQNDETNKVAIAFVKKAKKLLKPATNNNASEPKASQISYSIGDKEVGEGKLTSKGFSLVVTKENMPEDVYKKFIDYIADFFKQPLAQEQTPGNS